MRMLSKCLQGGKGRFVPDYGAAGRILARLTSMMGETINRDELLAKLNQFFETYPGVRLAYLFGSVASGRQTRESDADVAVLLDEGYTYAAVTHLSGALTDLLHHEVDLVVLNDCNPLVAKAAVQGILLWARNRVESLYFTAQVDREADEWVRFIGSYLDLLEGKGGTNRHNATPR